MVKNKEFSKNDAQMLQGLCILAMILLHLFDKDYHGLFTPIVYIKSIPLSYYFGQLSDFCVAGFAFCSGFGHMYQQDSAGYSYKKRLEKLLLLLMRFWVICILFSIVSVIIGNASVMPGDPLQFVKNMLLIDNSYNGAWWYLFTYSLLVLASPFIVGFVKKANAFIVLGAGLAVYVVSFYIRYKFSYSNWFLERFALTGMTLFEYLIGAEFQKYSLFDKLKKILTKIPVGFRILIFVSAFIGLLIGHTLLLPSVFFAPFTGVIIIVLFQFSPKPRVIKKAFLFLGNHSTNIWLTHMFFISVIFVNLVYIAKYPVLILLFMLLLTIAVSIILSLINTMFLRIRKNM